MKKSLTLATLATASAALPAFAGHGQATAARDGRPNVIVILADDLGYGDLSCYGATRVQTPTIDSLARCGTRFTNAHACAATSTPSRYGLLTGEYPLRRRGTDVAAGNAGMIIPPERYTVADAFHAAGYHTAAFGKWHLGLGSRTAEQDWNGQLDQTPADLGFDYHYIMAATADRVPCVYIENGRVANYDAAAPIYVDYQRNFPGEPTGRTHPQLLTKQRSSHGHDQAIVGGIGRIGYMKGGGRALWRDEDIADSIASHAVRYIHEHRESPFFMYFCTNDVHVPRMPHERFRGKSPMGLRGEAILQFDATVRQITDALRAEGLADNTIIILTSDNGPVLDDGYDDRAVELVGDHRPGGPFRGGKYSSFEAGSVVPLIVCGTARVRRGHVSNALLSQVDLTATMAQLLGIPVPAGAAPDSQPYLAAWMGRERKGRDWAFKTGHLHSHILRTQQWTYIAPKPGPAIIPWGPIIETGCSEGPQLYSVRRDVAQQHNVADVQPRVVNQMQAILEALQLP